MNELNDIINDMETNDYFTKQAIAGAFMSGYITLQDRLSYDNRFCSKIMRKAYAKGFLTAMYHDHIYGVATIPAGIQLNVLQELVFARA